ncbi:MAG: hypothetical protein AAF743_11160 [Planctomycetota bacterium]
MRNHNAPGVGRRRSKVVKDEGHGVANVLRRVGVYGLPLVMIGGLWVLAGLYYVAMERKVPQPAPAVVPPILEFDALPLDSLVDSAAERDRMIG